MKQADVSTPPGTRLALPFDLSLRQSVIGEHAKGSVFSFGSMPTKNNIIVFDDFVTPGSTMNSMKNRLEPLGKNSYSSQVQTINY